MIVQDQFAEIHHLDDLKQAIEDKEEIRVHQQPNGYFVVAYQIADNHTFDSLEALECRGITFYPNGELAARPLHKFFNLGEKPETFKENLPSLNEASQILYKEDGSLIHPVLGPDSEVLWKSKKTFDSSIIQQVMNHKTEAVDCMAKELLQSGLTPSFEWTAPENRIVLPYHEPVLKLLHIRHTYTGDYLPQRAVRNYAQCYGLGNLVPWLPPFSEWNDLIHYLQSQEHMEGVVVQFANGEMVKVKTPWYQTVHKTLSYARERDIAQAVLEETIDDYKAILHEIGVDLTSVEAVEDQVVAELNRLRHLVEEIHAQDQTLARKDFAIKHKAKWYFPLLMQKYQEKEPDYVSFYKKHCLPNFSLELVT